MTQRENTTDRTVNVWMLPCDADDRREASWTAMLDSNERRRLRRFRFEADRRQYLTAHALLRTALSQYADAAPGDWRFKSARGGKPEIAGPRGAEDIRFSLSHTRRFAACAIVDQPVEVGLDVEAVVGDGILEAARQFLSPAQRDAFCALEPDQRRERLFKHWTLKEAYAKARGLGLAMPLSAAEFQFASDGRITARFDEAIDDNAETWQFESFAPAAGFRIALAVRRTGGVGFRIVRRMLRPEHLNIEQEDVA